jgi:hypothetical protein
VTDPYWADVSGFGYQALQPHQDDVIAAVEAHGLVALRAAVAGQKQQRQRQRGAQQRQ